MRDATDKHKLCPGLALMLSAGLVLAFAPAAFAAGDPVKNGRFDLKLAKTFKKQLTRNGVVMKPKVLRLDEGSINPLTGAGEVTLKGKLRFRHGRRKAVYKDLTAKLGKGGVLSGTGRGRYAVFDRRPTKLFSLRGGSVTRNGFGADIRGVKVKFLRSAARRINRKLGLHSLRRVRAGSLSVSEQPQTVEVTGGSVHLVSNADLTEGSGTVASKLFDHCINGLNGVTAIPPAVKNPPAVSPSFDFPVSGGTIGPQGTDGEVQLAGGIRLANTTSVSGCGSAPPRNLRQADLAYNLLNNYISAHVVIEGPPAPLGGDQGEGIGSNLNTTNATVSSDPDQKTVTINGIVVTINAGGALFLNQTFQQPTYDPSQEFVSGDINGVASLQVSTR